MEDQLIVTFPFDHPAERLLTCTRESDTVARIGEGRRVLNIAAIAGANGERS